MKNSSLLMASALAGSLVLPAAVMAQGSSNYGIFGNGAGQNTGFSNAGFGNSSAGRSGFGQGQSGFAGQQSFGGAMGRSPAIGMGSGANVVSPYLNLLRPGSSAAVNYYALVRPQIRQDQINTQYSNNIQQADRMLQNQQQWLNQNVEPYLNNTEAMPAIGRTPEPTTSQPTEQRRRVTQNADTGFHDWATDFKDQGAPADSRSMDSRQREAKARQARELKELEKELLGETPPAGTSTTQAQTPTQQGQARTAPTFPAPVGLSRSANHYFPKQGGSSNRTGSLGGQR